MGRHHWRLLGIIFSHGVRVVIAVVVVVVGEEQGRRRGVVAHRLGDVSRHEAHRHVQQQNEQRTR